MAKPLRLALGACIIQAEYGYDDEKLPFDPSLMVYFRKRLTPEVLGEINEMIVRDAKERQVKEAKSKAETLLDVLHDPADGKKPRTYRKRARKDYLKYTRCRKHTAKMTRKAIGKQLA